MKNTGDGQKSMAVDEIPVEYPDLRPLTPRLRKERVVDLRDVAVQLGGRTIWSEATLSVRAGEFIAVLGPNGSGKSTLLKVLLGLVRPISGGVEVLGSEPRRGNPVIGYVPQHRTLDPDLTVRGRDLVRLGLEGGKWGFPLPGAERRRIRAMVAQAIDSVNGTDLADRPIGQLSGGEQQRLLLAQAIVGCPRLLLLDEPLANLDLHHQAAMVQLIELLTRAIGSTVLLVGHDINPLLPVVDRVIYIANGKVVIGDTAEIVNTETLSRLYDAPVEVLRDSLGRLFVVGV